MVTFTGARAAIPFVVASSLLAWAVQAAVSPEQAAALGKTLTPFGAEQAASVDGTIPAYTGGMPALHAGGKLAAQGDPFAGDQPTVRIAAYNLEESKTRTRYRTG